MTPAARVVVPPELKGTPDEVRLLRHGWQRADADSVGRHLLSVAEQKYGPESLEAADALDVLVWGVTFGLYDPLGDVRKVEDLLPLASRALSIKEAALDSMDIRLAASLDNMACLRGFQGDSTQSRQFAERSLAIRSAAHGPGHPKTAESLRLVGHLALHFGDAAGALEHYKQALEIQENTLQPFDLEIGETLFWMIFAEDAVSGDYRLSYPIWIRLLEIYEKSLGRLQLKTVLCRVGLAQKLPSVRPEEAEAFYHEALRLTEVALGPRHVIVERTYMDMANYYCLNLKPIEGDRFMRRALRQFPDSPWVLLWSGTFYARIGDYDQAIELMDRAVTVMELNNRENHWLLGTILGSRGSTHLAAGSYSEARGDFLRSRQIFETQPTLAGNALAYYPWTLVGLAELGSRTGDYSEIESLYRLAIDANQEVQAGTGGWLEGDHGLIRCSFGQALLRMNKPSAALAEFHQAEAIIDWASAYQAEEWFTSDVLQGMAEAHLALAHRDTAMDLFHRCLAMRVERLGAEHPSVTTTLLGLSLVERQEGKLDSARAHLERAIDIAGRAYNGPHPELSQSLEALALVQLEEGDAEGALQSALRGEAMSREHMRLTAQGLAERRALAFAAVRTSGLDCALTAALAIETQDAIHAAWDAVIRSRGMVLDEMAERRRLVIESDDAVADSLNRELRRVRTHLANLMVRGFGYQDLLGAGTNAWIEAPVDQKRALYAELQRTKENLEESLAERSTRFREDRRRWELGSEDVIEATPPGAAAVSYWRYRPVLRGEDALSEAEEEAYLAFVFRQGQSEVALVPIGTASEIDRAVNEWRGLVSRTNVTDEEYQRVAASLRRRIWDPVATYLGDSRRVFIIPDGALHLVSLPTLTLDSGEYMTEGGPQMHYLSAERDLATYTRQTIGGEGLLALGDPLFDENPTTADPQNAGMNRAFRGMRSSCGELRSAHFDPLPETAAEVQEVCALWSETDSSAQALLGGRASEAAFKSQVAEHRVVHVATHGFFLGGECRSALEGSRAIGGIATAGVNELPTTEVGENPLLLSGLALAGANRREEAGPEEEDGILTAEEIASLDLSGVEWAVLSACQTGMGEVRLGEGVFGLRRAFQIAGARTLIMSLWPVEDEATRQWMKRLYEARLVDGLDTAESVRQASLRTLNERRANGESTHPFYWGAFVAAGDWR